MKGFYIVLCNVIHFRAYNYKNKDGVQKSGSQVTYSNAVPAAPRGNDVELGSAPVTVRGEFNLCDVFKSGGVPGRYDLDIDLRQDNAGNAYGVCVGARSAASLNGAATPATAGAAR